MGSLDDAIREHLELKRQHGASDEEVKRQEEEAFGRGRRPPAEEAPAAEQPVPEEISVDEHLEAAEPQSNGQPAEHAEPASSFEAEVFEPDEVPAAEALEPEVTVRDARDDSSWEEPQPADPEPAEPEPAEPEPSSDPLQETPDFLEGSPEEDKLWFEQRPPKDFDLD